MFELFVIVFLFLRTRSVSSAGVRVKEGILKAHTWSVVSKNKNCEALMEQGVRGRRVSSQHDYLRPFIVLRVECRPIFGRDVMFCKR